MWEQDVNELVVRRGCCVCGRQSGHGGEGLAEEEAVLVRGAGDARCLSFGGRVGGDGGGGFLVFGFEVDSEAGGEFGGEEGGELQGRLVEEEGGELFDRVRGEVVGV